MDSDAVSAKPIQERLPFELLTAICARLAHCPCTAPDTRVFSAGCTGNHAPGAFNRGELSALRQTSHAWRAAALREGLSQIVASNRWMRSGGHDRLQAISRGYAACVRRLVFRSSDFYPNGPRRSADGAVASELEAVLAMQWPCLEAVVIEWFSGSAADHARILAAVKRWTPRVRELYVHDKLVSLPEMAPLLWGAAGPQPGERCAAIRRLAIKPYGYNQRWSALLPAERGAADMLRRMPGQLTALAIGGADFTPELLAALQTSQPALKFLSVEHAWIDVLAAANVCLPSVTRLHLENVIFARSDALLPLTPRMFPALRSLTLRHTWQQAAQDGRGDSARGAVSLQDEGWLSQFWAHQWPQLRSLALPAIADIDAVYLARACPALERLSTNSLDYAGPKLSAAGLVDVLRLQRLRHLSIEQRRSNGSPGYHILDAALCRLIGSDDEDTRFGDRLMHRASTTSTIVEDSPELAPRSLSGSDTEVDSDVDDFAALLGTTRLRFRVPTPTISTSLNSLCMPRASFTVATLDALLKQLPNLVKLSVSMRSDAFATFSKGPQRPWTHCALKRIALTADEDILTDPHWLSAWLVQRFPMLEECSTNHARSHKQIVTELRAAAPAIAFTRLNSRALQMCS
ncbi:hypothetical protein H4S02_003532 [Coemansia sp. RSA 2611]|nr:hypothetical protein H4S02_003532 [Coemansia sp. RSA 2611]